MIAVIKMVTSTACCSVRDAFGQQQRDQAADDDGTAAQGEKIEHRPEQITGAPGVGRLARTGEIWNQDIGLGGVGHGGPGLNLPDNAY